MKLSTLTHEFLKQLSLQKDASFLLDCVIEKIKENNEAILGKGYRLDVSNNGAALLHDFRKDLEFIKEGINGSWKDDITNDDTQRYYWYLQKQIEKILEK